MVGIGVLGISALGYILIAKYLWPGIKNLGRLIFGSSSARGGERGEDMASSSKKARSAANTPPAYVRPDNRIKADNPPEEEEVSDFTKWCAVGIFFLSCYIGIAERSFLAGVGTFVGGLLGLALVINCVEMLMSFWRAHAKRALCGVVAFVQNGAVWGFWPLRWTLGFVVRAINRYLGVPGWILLFGALALGVFQQTATLYGNGWDLMGELALDVFIPILWPFLLLWDIFMGMACPLVKAGIATVQGLLTVLFGSPVTVLDAVFWE